MKFKKNLYLRVIIVLLCLFSVITFFYLKKNNSDHIVINEVSFSSSENVDWIEIYNPTLNNLSLQGLYLSDKSNNISKYKIKDEIYIMSGGFTVIYCDGYSGDLDNSVTTNFKISNGETIYLVARDGSSVIDSFTAIHETDEKTEATIGRFPDGSNEIFVMSQPTKGEKNVKDMINNSRIQK